MDAQIVLAVSRGVIYLVGAAIMWRRSKTTAGLCGVFFVVSIGSLLGLGAVLDAVRVGVSLIVVSHLANLVGRATALTHPRPRD